jgi:hypothetical protein
MVSALLGVCWFAVAQPVWPGSLYVSWGPHERRVEVTVRNTGSEPVAGTAVHVPVGTQPGQLPLEGWEVSALRATDATGRELLWAVTGPSGAPKTRGPLGAGDIVLLPVECAAGASASLLVYYDNPKAWPVPEMLATGLGNTTLDEGSEAGPLGWGVGTTDAAHRLAWSPDEGRGGSGCAKCVVDAGAPSTWVQYRQAGIAVAPGARYRLSAWVKARDCTGSVGWYVHVDGAQPLLVNQVESAGEGSYDWKEIRYEFTAPEGSRDATIGTVLFGTGTAWYDDLTFEALDGDASLEVSVGPEQRLGANRLGAPDPESGWYALVPRLESTPASGILVLADTRMAEIAWQREHADWSTPIRARLAVPGSAGEPADFAGLGAGLLACDLPANTILTCPVRVEKSDERPSLLRDAERLARHAGNLVTGATLETAADLAAWGGAAAEGGAPGAQASLAEGAEGCGQCLKLDVPKEVAPQWVGVRQGPLAIRPGASYYLGALVKTGDLGDVIRIHAHIHDASGKTITYLSTGQGLGANQDWTWLSTSFRAPAEAADVQIHLTMNTWGTALYDNVSLFEVAQPGPLRRAPLEPDDLSVAAVDSVVKVFPEDRIVARPEARLALGRNEYEPLQLAVRLPAGQTEARVTIAPVRGEGGAELPAPTLERVDTVPVDAPTAYYRTEAPAWCRRIPEGSGSSDGWPGWWPDPLVPVAGGTVTLPSDRTTALWLTFHAPKDAAAGQYRSEVRVSCAGKEGRVPVTLTVRDFTLPDETRLRAVLDLRDGTYPKSIFGSTDPDGSREAWYRLLAAHRVTPDIPGPEPTFAMQDGKVTMDSTAFDRWATLCLDELKMNHLYTPWFFYALGWAYRPSERFGFAAFTPEYEKAMSEAYRIYLDHLTERGWRGRLIHYVSDEPHFYANRQVSKDLQGFCAIFQRIAPDVPRYSSTWSPAPSLEGAITLWGAGHYGCFPVAKMKERQAAGDGIFITTDGQMCIDTPYLATERMLPTYAFTYGAIGYEFWGVSWWTYDPWEWGWHSFISQSDEGTNSYWVRYPNGDGYLTYPGERYGVNGPLSSIRLEQAREGQEDAEALNALRIVLALLPGDARERAEAEKVLAEAEALVPIPNAGGLRSSQVFPDPSRLMRLHERLGAVLEECSRAVRPEKR